MSEKINLGQRVKDRVTGIEGVVTSRTIYVAGSDRIQVEYVAGGKAETLWVEAARCDLVLAAPVNVAEPALPAAA